MKVILIGYRATGKSTVGSILSGKLKIPFADTDSLIEQAAGMAIREIVAREGWEAFRKQETQALKRLASHAPGVVATGGGIVVAEENRTLLKNMGVVVYLRAELSDIVERLKRDHREGQTRPPLTGADSLEAETSAVLGERTPIYQSLADFTVDTQGKSVVRVADSIHDYLRDAGVLFEINRCKKQLKQQS